MDGLAASLPAGILSPTRVLRVDLLCMPPVAPRTRISACCSYGTGCRGIGSHPASVRAGVRVRDVPGGETAGGLINSSCMLKAARHLRWCRFRCQHSQQVALQRARHVPCMHARNNCRDRRPTDPRHNL